MNFDLLWTAAMPIPFHAIAAIAALLIGGLQLAMTKGTAMHRWMGFGWVGLLGFVALSGLFIHEIRVVGPFSPIHLLSILTLVTLYRAVRAARLGQIKLHKGIMQSLYFIALVITGAFTLLPGRAMHNVVFGN